MSALSSAQFPEIHLEDLNSGGDARRSREVSHDEFQRLASLGQRAYDLRKANASPAIGLTRNWADTVSGAYAKTRRPWGGATIDAHSGNFLRDDADRYAITVREPGVSGIAIPDNSRRGHFEDAMTHARDTLQPILERAGHHLGVFHDAERGQFYFDPGTTVGSLRGVEALGAYTRAVGGAYHARSGLGFWPPHVAV